MEILLKNVLWINPGDPLHWKNCSIRIQNGLVSEISDNPVSKSTEEIVDAGGLLCSPGWIDLHCRNGAPGRQENESLHSLFHAAAAGGFTQIQILPDTRPIVQSLESVQYYRRLENKYGIETLVSAAATLDLEGKKMAEYLTLEKAGASSFSSIYAITNAGFFTRILQYLQHSESVLFHHNTDPELSLDGQMHEGVVSDRRGLAGIPSVAEEIMIQRDIRLLQYAGGKLHIPLISSEGSLNFLLEAKKSIPGLTFSIAAHQLAFTHENLDQFDTVHKVFPPYRLEADRKALISAVESGLVDAIVSDHTPLHYDYKDIEFENASFGISSLETTYSTLVTFARETSAENQVRLLSTGPRKILGMDPVFLKAGMPADFTLFSPEKTWTPETSRWQSKSHNNPFLGQELRGVVFGIATKKGFHSNPTFQLPA